MMISWWLAVYQIQKDIGLIVSFNTMEKIIFLLAGGFGIASYLVTLTFILKKTIYLNKGFKAPKKGALICLKL